MLLLNLNSIHMNLLLTDINKRLVYVSKAMQIFTFVCVCAHGTKYLL